MKTRTRGYIKQLNWKLYYVLYILCISLLVICTLFPKNYTYTFENYQHQSVQEYLEQQSKSNGIESWKVLALVNCESSFNQYAVNVNRNGTKDLGLFQINDVHGLSEECRFSKSCSTKWALKEIKKNGYKAWVCGRILGLDK